MKKSIVIIILVLVFLTVAIGAFFGGIYFERGTLNPRNTAYFVLNGKSEEWLSLKSVVAEGKYQTHLVYYLSANGISVTENGAEISINALNLGDIIAITYTGELTAKDSTEIKNAKAVARIAEKDSLSHQYRSYGTVMSVSQNTIYIGDSYLELDEDTTFTWRGKEISVSDIQVGDFIAYDYNGYSLAVYPTRIPKVYGIELLESKLSKEPEIFEGILTESNGTVITVKAENGDTRAFTLSEETTLIDYTSSFLKTDDLTIGDTVHIYYKENNVILVRVLYVPTPTVENPPESQEPVYTVFESPADEKAVTKNLYAENEDGVKMEINLRGYTSESLGMGFYVKSHEYFHVEVKVTNGTNADIHQILPVYCHGVDHAYHHELTIDLTNTSGKSLTPYHTNYPCPDMMEVWTIPAGESYSWSFLLAAGEYSYEDYDLSSRIKLYGGEIYTNGICEFSGAIAFDYSYENKERDTKNEKSLKADVSVAVVYTPDEDLTVPVFESPADETTATKIETEVDDNGLRMDVTFHGYKSEHLGMDFYVKSHEYFTVEVTLTNNTGYDIHQWIPTYCHESDHAHLHELTFSLKHHLAGALTPSNGSVVCPQTGEVWTLPKGESYTWTFRLAAGELVSENYDLSCDDMADDEGILLFGKENYYPYGKLTFSGTSTFKYAILNEHEKTENRYDLKAYIGVTVVYTGKP